MEHHSKKITTKNKVNNPYCILIEDWKEAGLPKESWTRIAFSLLEIKNTSGQYL